MSERVLLTATPGGHIQELHEWVRRIADLPAERVWVTARTPQTESLLAGEEVIWVPAVSTRQLHRVVPSIPLAMQIARRVRPTMVVSTGAALTVPYIHAAIAQGAVCHFIESATRTLQPSLTGRIMHRTPGVIMHAHNFDDDRWLESGSLFESFQARPREQVKPIRKVLVTLGTERFDFSRAVRSIFPVLPPNTETLWQVGTTQAEPPVGRSVSLIPHAEMTQAIAEADVVITHAGVGSVLSALDAGHYPVVLPRSSRHNEHVDDHQIDLGALLKDQELAVVRDPYNLTAEDLVAASQCSTHRDEVPTALHLDGEGAALHLDEAPGLSLDGASPLHLDGAVPGMTLDGQVPGFDLDGALSGMPLGGQVVPGLQSDGAGPAESADGAERDGGPALERA